MTMQLGVGAWLDPRALGDTGGSIFHSVHREITQEYAPGNFTCSKYFLGIVLDRYDDRDDKDCILALGTNMSHG